MDTNLNLKMIRAGLGQRIGTRDFNMIEMEENQCVGESGHT
jgi:hypothetical protein